jgi:hypothetical protein
MEENRPDLAPEPDKVPTTTENTAPVAAELSLADQILAEYAAKAASADAVAAEPEATQPEPESTPVAEEAVTPEVVAEITPEPVAQVEEVVVEAVPAVEPANAEPEANVVVEHTADTTAEPEAATEEIVALAEAEVEAELDLAGLDKKSLADHLETYTAQAYSTKNDAAIRKIKAAFDHIEESERSVALEKFLADGGEEDAFELKADGTSVRFNNMIKLYREKRRVEAVEAERSKEKNQARKLELLELLRQLVESDEEITSLDKLKKIEDEWKSIGPVPNTFAQDIRSNYGALRNLFYDRRSIYFELKELDRKKNLESKLGYIEKAKALVNEKALNKAVKELNELHEEWRNTGPVPKEEQEKIWAEFKALSDQIYTRRREYVDKIKVEQNENLGRKEILIEKALLISNFKADKFDEWNNMSQEVMKLEEEWKTIGNVPIEKANDVNKRFWGYIKQFFNAKHGYFKALDKEKAQNLAAKTALCVEAEGLQDSEDWEAAANALKQLQTRWKEIGPVPTKVRDSIYERFKAAVDKFFERKRQLNESTEKEYEVNLAAKRELLAKLEASIAAKTATEAEIQAVVDQFTAIGFVPRKAMDTLSKDVQRISEAYLEAIEGINPTDLIKLKVSVHSRLTSRGGGRSYDGERSFDRGDRQDRGDRGDRGGRRDGGDRGGDRGGRGDYRGGGDRRGGDRRGATADDGSLRGMERNLRTRIQSIENQIHSYENNLSFFANSRNADSLRKDVEGKVKGLTKELDDVRSQLKIVQQGLADEAKASS